MITIRKNNYVPYDELENPSHKVIFYPDLFADDVASKVIKSFKERSMIDVATTLSHGLSNLIGIKFTLQPNTDKPIGSSACILFGDHLIKLENQKTGEKITIHGHMGTVVIFGSMFREDWGYTVPRKSILLYEYNPLPYIYTSINQRLKYAHNVKEELKEYQKLPEWKQCVHKHIPMDDHLGSGCYGNVFKSSLGSKSFAIKLSKLKKDTLKDHPYSRNYSSWYEVHILKDIINPIITKGICPNLPLLIDTFACDNCELKLSNKKVEVPCVITMVELANGTLKDFMNANPNSCELYSCVFQIMAGLHAIQKYGQVMNYDIKAENILWYKVESGGYWKYIVHGKTFYVPNYGKLFVINDFGISRPMSPNLPLYRTPKDTTFRLGSRYAVVKNGKFLPFNTDTTVERDGTISNSPIISWGIKKSRGGQYSMLRDNNKVISLKTKLHKNTIRFLESRGINHQIDLFTNPEIIPPFEFYNDTQDAIRTFIGGKRTTQKGNHHKYKIPNKLLKELRKFNGRGESIKNNTFSRDPAQVLAGYFIVSFFSKHTKFLIEPEGKKLAMYTMS